MAVDRTKILEAAQKHLSKGAYDKAIVELQKLVKADPSDVRTWLKIGDLYVKLNQRPQAIDTYARVADQYAGQGFFHKAVAVYKQILNLDGTRLDVKLKLAEMHESMQLTSDAMAAYEHVAAEYGRLGDADRALATFGKMVSLDPTNIPTRIKYAEALSRAGRNEEAAVAFEAGAELLKKQGRIDDYLKVVERLLFHREDVERSRELAELYLERNDGKRALAKLQVLFKADPKHIPTLELLARAFEQVQQLPKTISVLREIARLYGDKGNVEERARALKRIVALDPGDPEARQALAQMVGPARPSAPARRDLAPPPGAVIEASKPARMMSEPPEEIDPDDEPYAEEEALADDGLDDEGTEGDDAVISYVDEDAEAEIVAAAAEERAALEQADGAGDDAADDDVFIVEEEPVEEEAPPEAVQRTSLPPDVAREAHIAKLLTEVDVFLRYGLKQKVVEQLRQVLELEPRHVEAREKLKDVLVERGEITAAADELVALADIFALDSPAVAALYLRQARDLDPANELVRQRLASLPISPSQPPRAATPLPPMPTPLMAVAPSEPPIDLDDPTGESLPADDLLVAPQRPQPVASYLTARGPKVQPPRVEAPGVAAMRVEAPRLDVPKPSQRAPEPTPEPDGFYEDERTVFGGAIPDDFEDMLEERAPMLPDPYAGAVVHDEALIAGADPLAPISPEEFESVPLRPSIADDLAPARASLPPGEVEEILDEAEFFVAQGLYDEGIQVLRDAVAAHPNNRLLVDKIAELEEQAARAVAAMKDASHPPPPVDNSFQLAEKLADELGGGQEGSDVLDVEEVFAQFKKGVEQQVAVDDADTHFDLGIAYKEMGLIADAIHEFELCLTHPTRECMAHTMIGLCHLEKGDVAAAVGAFKKGLYSERKTEREELGLYYELGRAYERMRDPQEALYYYEKVKKRDPSFLQVQDRIDALTAPRPQAAEGATQDLDAAFDELMGKD